MKNLLLCVSLFLGVFITGCNKVLLTDLQKRELQSKDLQGSFDDAYKANLQVLQDYGYVIKSTARDSGVIQGETAFRKDKKYFWNGLLVNDEATATLEQFGPNTVKERLSLVRKTKKRSTNVVSMTSIFVEDAETVVNATFIKRCMTTFKKKCLFVRTSTNRHKLRHLFYCSAWVDLCLVSGNNFYLPPYIFINSLFILRLQKSFPHIVQ